MTTPTDPRPLANTQDSTRAYCDETTDSLSSNKYSRLEDLLHQTLALAAEIVEAQKCHNNPSDDKKRITPARLTSPPATTLNLLSGCECIIISKSAAAAASGPGSPSFPRYHSYSSSNAASPPVLTNGARRANLASGDDDSFNADTSSVTSPSAASSVQEPFSPGTLALSLDAIVEQKQSDHYNHDQINETTHLDPLSSSLTSLGGAAAAAAGRRPEWVITAASSQPPTPNSPQECPPPSPSAHGAMSSTLRSRSNHHRPSSPPPPPPEGTCCNEQQSAATLASSQWYVRVLPIFSPCHVGHGANIDSGGGGGGSRGAAASSLMPPLVPVSPTHVKLEAVLPYRFACDSGLATAGLNEEGSHITIGRPPQEGNNNYGISGSGQVYLPCPFADCFHELQTVPASSLQDFLDDWECPAGLPESDEGRSESKPTVSG